MSGWWLVSYLALWGLVLLAVVVLLVVLRQLGLVYQRVRGGLQLDEGPPIGAQLEAFGETDERTGEEFVFPTSEATLNLLFFASPYCEICKDALRGLRAAIRRRDVSAAIVSDGTSAENAELQKLVGDAARFVINRYRQRLLRVESVPFGIVTTGEGVVLEKLVVNSLDDLETLLDRAEAKQGVDEQESMHLRVEASP